MTFQGFGPEALPFFKALKFHQSREWFEANRATYESAIKGPMGDLVEDVAERLRHAKIPIKGDRKSSAFRIHRDVRFSSNKDPYKTNAGVALTRSGGKAIPASSTSTCRPKSASSPPASTCPILLSSAG